MCFHHLGIVTRHRCRRFVRANQAVPVTGYNEKTNRLPNRGSGTTIVPMKTTKIFFAILAGYLFGFAPGGFAAPLQVFVSIPPQKWLADQVGADLVSTHVLVDRGQEPHNFEPTPKQIAALSRATIYFTVDLQFEREIARKLQQARTGVKLIDVTASIQKISITGSRPGGGDANRGADQQRLNGLDPHVWLAPANLKSMARAMAAAMATADPDNILSYERNLKAVTAALDQLNEHIEQTLAPYRGSTFFVFHPAFGYFAHAYGLHQEAVEVAGKSPAPRQLRFLIRRAKADGVRVVFVQPQFDPKSAQAVAHAIGGEVVPLDPLAEDVVGNLKIMAEKIQAALKSSAPSLNK